MYIAVCGSEVDKTDGLTEARARLLGRVIASKGYTLLTGGCDGIPQAAVLGATERGGRCEAVSPAANLESHINDYNFPTEGSLCVAGCSLSTW